jgi:hypothetical protein
MKPILTLTHNDTVSGTTIMDDGTKVYWTEGRSSYVTIIGPDGSIAETAVSDPKLPAVILELPGDAPMQQMTDAEELEYDLTRGRGDAGQMLDTLHSHVGAWLARAAKQPGCSNTLAWGKDA